MFLCTYIILVIWSEIVEDCELAGFQNKPGVIFNLFKKSLFLKKALWYNKEASYIIIAIKTSYENFKFFIWNFQKKTLHLLV